MSTAAAPAGPRTTELPLCAALSPLWASRRRCRALAACALARRHREPSVITPLLQLGVRHLLPALRRPVPLPRASACAGLAGSGTGTAKGFRLTGTGRCGETVVGPGAAGAAKLPQPQDCEGK